MGTSNRTPHAPSSAVERIAKSLHSAFEGSEAELIGNPVVFGSGVFQLAIASPAFGCHLFVNANGASSQQVMRTADALVAQLRKAAPGWGAVTAWVVTNGNAPCPVAPRKDRRLMPWPSTAIDSPDQARRTLIDATPGVRPSISDRRRAMRSLAAAFRDPLGAFDGFDERRRRDRGFGTLREQLDVLDDWLSRRTLDADQGRLAEVDIAGRLLDVRGPAGSGKTTMLARRAARDVQTLAPTAGAARTVPTILVTARTASAAAQLRARLHGAFRRWAATDRLPPWVDTMDLASAAERVQARRALGGFEGYVRIFVDEAHELDERALHWVTTRALHASHPRRGVMACSDDGQRLLEEPVPVGAAASAGELVHRRQELAAAYRAPRQVIEFAFNLLHGTFARSHAATAARTRERGELLRRWAVEQAADGWLQVRFAVRGIGLEGGPPGAPVRCVRARSARAAAATAVRDALALVDVHGAAPADVVVVAADPRAAAAVSRAATEAGAAARFTRRAKDPSDPPKQLVRILHVSECRGHDFPVVLLTGLERATGTSAERTLLYQAATRAQHLLVAYGVAGTGISDEAGECGMRVGG